MEAVMNHPQFKALRNKDFCKDIFNDYDMGFITPTELVYQVANACNQAVYDGQMDEVMEWFDLL